MVEALKVIAGLFYLVAFTLAIVGGVGVAWSLYQDGMMFSAAAILSIAFYVAAIIVRSMLEAIKEHRS